jgi:hypothetical protein
MLKGDDHDNRLHSLRLSDDLLLSQGFQSAAPLIRQALSKNPFPRQRVFHIDLFRM